MTRGLRPHPLVERYTDSGLAHLRNPEQRMPRCGMDRAWDGLPNDTPRTLAPFPTCILCIGAKR